MSLELLKTIYPPLDEDVFERFLSQYFAVRRMKSIRYTITCGDTLELASIDLAPYFLPAACGLHTSVELGDLARPSSSDKEYLQGEAGAKLQVRLVMRLAGGMRRWAQVWVAKKSRRAEQVDQRLSAIPAGLSLVVKLFHDVRYQTPEWDDIVPEPGRIDKGLGNTLWLPSPVAAARECVAFGRLQDVQGLCTPRSLGFYVARPHGGEEVAAHVMREIRGETFGQALLRLQNDPESLTNLIDTFNIVLQLIHERGVIHRDLKNDHVIVSKSRHNPGGFRVRLLDFGFSNVLRPSFDYRSYAVQPLGKCDPFACDHEAFCKLVWRNPVFDYEDMAELRGHATAWLNRECAAGRHGALVINRHLGRPPVPVVAAPSV